MKRIIATVCLALVATPADAGIRDLFRFNTSTVPADVAEKRVRAYLDDVVRIPGLKVADGHGSPTSAEMKGLDSHITSRTDRAPEMVTARVTGKDVSGVVIVAGPGVTRPGWAPAKGYLAYLSLDSKLVFPEDADRAQALVSHLIGEPALFGFAPEAGPLWRVTERYLTKNYSAMPGDGARFADSEGPGPYQVREGERSPDEEEIPAWVVRGIGDLPGKHDKPVEMGLLLALTRRPGTSFVRLTHVTGVGSLGKALFKDAQRAKKDGDE